MEPKTRGIAPNIAALDLAFIHRALVDEGRPPEQASTIVEEYRKFLTLKLRHGQTSTIVPSPAIDTCWHTHMLDSRRYFADCEAVFGSYVHHDPDFGRGTDGRPTRALGVAAKNTRRLYVREFGVNPDNDIWDLPMLCG